MAEQAKPKDPQKELEILVGELEDRVDRLRALYEQYFLGFEKIEPSVPRKDVDRRFAYLRKQQIRNTALRFKFNVITQKFQTYSMYWARICRQIEEGTYKRHLAKASQRFSDAAAKRQSKPDDFELDIDTNDFDDGDVAALLAEADAEAASFRRLGSGQDTLPPGQATDPPPIEIRPPQAAIPVAPGSKPRVVLRRKVEGEPVERRVESEPFENPGNLPLIMPRSAPQPAPKPAIATAGPRPPAPSTPNAVARPPAPSTPNAVARPPAPSTPNAAPRPPAPSTPNAAVRPPAPSTPNAAPRPPAPSTPNAAPRPPGPVVIRPAGAPVQRIALPSAATGPSPAPAGSTPTPSTPMQPRPIIRRAPPTPDREKKEP